MQGGAAGPQFTGGHAYSAPVSSFNRAADTFSQAAPARRVSMAETLEATFGGSENLGGRAAQRVDEAYGKFRTFGL
jgi:hypothetical protein